MKFNEIYSTYYNQVLHFIDGKIRNVNVSQELTNDVFLKVHQNIDTFDHTKAKLVTWIFTIAKNKVIDHYRHVNKQRQIETNSIENYLTENGENGLFPQSKFFADTPLLSLDIIKQMKKAFDCISNKKAKRCFNLLINHNLSYNEIENKTGLPLGTIKAYINRAREQFIENY